MLNARTFLENFKEESAMVTILLPYMESELLYLKIFMLLSL